MKRSLFVLSLALAACTSGIPMSSQLSGEGPSAPESADLTVAFAGRHEIQDGEIYFQLEFANIGLPMEEEVDVRTKVFLIPKADYAQMLVDQGIVLETLITPLQLATGESVIVSTHLPLPNVPAGQYFLRATTNTRVSILGMDPDDGGDEPTVDPVELGIVVESRAAQLNNATHELLDLGHVVNRVDEPGNRGKYDLYHEVESARFELSGGTASHTSRNILRIMEGEDAIPPYDTWSNTISARFLFINLRDGTMSIGAYTSYEVDKIWYAIAWTAEADRAGRNVYVDYYHNAPSVSHLQPGEYLLGVLMNVNDRFELDSYPENNLDLTYVDLGAARIINSQSEVWLNVNNGARTTYLTANVHDRADLHEWSYSIDQQPEWLTIQEQLRDYQYELHITVDPRKVPLGLHVFDVTIRARDETQDLSVTSKLYVFKNEGPIVVMDGLLDGMTVTKDTPGAEIIDRAVTRFSAIRGGSATREPRSSSTTSRRVSV